MLKSVLRLLSYLFQYKVRMGGNLGTLGENLFKPRPICLKSSTIIYLTHAQTVVKPDFPLSSPFIGKRDMPATANEEEEMYL